jgi:hypothetical protein
MERRTSVKRLCAELGRSYRQKSRCTHLDGVLVLLGHIGLRADELIKGVDGGMEFVELQAAE